MVIGSVNAIDENNFKAPADFEDLGDGVYVLYDATLNADEILSIVKYNEHNWDDYTTNDTENKYCVYEENNTYNYTDHSVNEIGSFELVEVNNEKYIIDFAKTGVDSDLVETHSNLLEFNKLNNITPIKK